MIVGGDGGIFRGHKGAGSGGLNQYSTVDGSFPVIERAGTNPTLRHTAIENNWLALDAQSGIEKASRSGNRRTPGSGALADIGTAQG